MEPKIEKLIKNWQERNIVGYFCRNKEEAVDKILSIIAPASSIGISGSVTLEQLDISERLKARGNKVFDQYQKGLSQEDGLGLRRQGAQADYYLASANAVSENGELVFLSAIGNRTAGISYAKNVIIVCGVNKLTPNLKEALKRAREYATPLNRKRLNWQGAWMCYQTLIIEAEVSADRLKVILVGETLGF